MDDFDAMRESAQHTVSGLVADKMRLRRALYVACGYDHAKAMEALAEADKPGGPRIGPDGIRVPAAWCRRGGNCYCEFRNEACVNCGPLGVSASVSHPLPAQANDGGEHG